MDNRLFFSATQKNKDCIGDVLSRIIKEGSVLEIGSGSGEHGVFFQKLFPKIIWQTSDPDLVHRKSISSWIKYEDLTEKMPQPLEIDVKKIGRFSKKNNSKILDYLIFLNLGVLKNIILRLKNNIEIERAGKI